MSSQSIQSLITNTAYNAASHYRKALRTWRPKQGDSDTDDIPALPELRVKSRDGYRNQLLVRSAINTKRYNTIGAGLTLQSKIDHKVIGMSAEKAAEWQRIAQFEFKLWSENKNCDAERTKDFYTIQDVAFTSTLLSGDICALTPYIDRGSTYSLAVKLLEADRICNPNNAMDTHKISGGVENDAHGAPVAYHFTKYHPGGHNKHKNEWERIEAYGKESGRQNVIHLVEHFRPGQRRGIPILAPVMEALKQLDKYTNAEIEAAVVSGLYAGFITSKSGEMDSNIDEYERVGGTTDLELSPGMIAELEPGEDIKFGNPGRPNANYEAFVTAVIKQIGAALDVPYEILMKHFSASYSASRGAILEAWKAFRTRRLWFARNFCQPIYEEFLYEAVLTGRIIAPGFLENEMTRKAYCGAIWNGPTPGQLDPEKETNAAVMRANERLSTRTKEAAELNGTNFAENCDTGKTEHEMLRESGYVFEGEDKNEN